MKLEVRRAEGNSGCSTPEPSCGLFQRAGFGKVCAAATSSETARR